MPGHTGVPRISVVFLIPVFSFCRINGWAGGFKASYAPPGVGRQPIQTFSIARRESEMPRRPQATKLHAKSEAIYPGMRKGVVGRGGIQQ